MPSTDPHGEDYRQKYRNLKRELKILIYENECFQEELRKAQRKLLKVNRDKSFLLDRLLQFEVVESSTSDSEATASSDSDLDTKTEVLPLKKKRAVPSQDVQAHCFNNPLSNSITPEVKKQKKSRKVPAAKAASIQQSIPTSSSLPIPRVEGHMTSEEIERHLEAKQALRDLMPEKTPLTVPAEMFSNESSAMEWLAAHLPAFKDSKLDVLQDVGVTDASPIAGTVSEDDGLIIDLHE